MRKAHLKSLTFQLVILFLFFPGNNGFGQDTSQTKIPVIDLLQELEDKFEVKFSFVDADLEGLQISKPTVDGLQASIDHIIGKTPLQIERLNDRYYSVVLRNTISICGTVLDNFENNSIPGATVRILDSDKAAVTNIDGQFSFEEVPRTAVVQISHLGFKTYFISAEELSISAPCFEIALALSYQELEEVVVYKFLTDGLAKFSDGSIQMNTAEFGILPGLIEPDILQSAQSLPGIKSVDETVSDINIRGGTNDQNLILWDGIKMYQSGHFFGLISAFNPYLTDKITIIKNGTSSVYGDGVSGVMDMRTKNDIQNSTFGGAGFNLISGDMYGQIPLSENLALQFSGRRSLTDFLQTPTYTTFSEKAFQDSEVRTDNDFYFYDFTGKLLYDLNPYHKVRLSLIHINNDLDNITTSNDGDEVTESSLDQINISFGGSLESEWTDNFYTQANVYYTQYRLTAFSITESASRQLYQNNLVKESSAKLNTIYKVIPTLQWTNGYQFTETGIENITRLNQPFFESNIKGVIRSHSLYSEIQYETEDKNLFAQFGGRLNYISNINTFDQVLVEPRLSISYEFATNFKLEVLGEFKSQYTNQIIDLEQNFLGLEKRRWTLADENNLPVVKSKQGSLGLNYDENRLYVGVEAFYKNVTGINVNTQGFQNQNQFNGEIGEYLVKGVEFLINKKTNDYSAWFSYAYNDNNYTFNTISPPNFPNNLELEHSFTLAGNYNYNNFKVGIGLNYRSGKPYTKPDSNTPLDTSVFPIEINYESPNSSSLPEYFRADASATYDFNLNKKVKASVGASVLNFTDRKNVLNTYYRLNDDNKVETVQRISLGVTPNASFRISF
ncbi:TonB-dependent receptor [Maribacter cobaltidurans]|uniref:TonB-dependent receptor n=1 Tax=Maribacter cobaltidurans TaxID=1178778 RepID=A0A223V1W1_9FLAO|nr:TonB-dependent receptor [Maribacter cobaltidurans]ASV29341.1 TonB-dependent receptor [Maribacter cobaltidurans]GGD69845.1 TonB-dependent receptor [Maribacter cobaltidurans]